MLWIPTASSLDRLALHWLISTHIITVVLSCGQPPNGSWRFYPLSCYEWEVCIRGEGGRVESGGRRAPWTPLSHSPAVPSRDCVYRSRSAFSQHSSRAVKLHKKIFCCKNKWASIVKRKLVMMHSVLWSLLRLTVGLVQFTFFPSSARSEDSKSDSLLCFVRVFSWRSSLCL